MDEIQLHCVFSGLFLPSPLILVWFPLIRYNLVLTSARLSSIEPSVDESIPLNQSVWQRRRGTSALYYLHSELAANLSAFTLLVGANTHL